LSPLIEGSILKQFAEQINAKFSFFSREQHLHLTVQAPTMPELQEAVESTEAKALPEHVEPAAPTTTDQGSPGLTLEMPNYINVIKAWDLKGSRAHVEFAILNDTDQLLAIRDVVLLVGRGDTPDALRFKQFVDVKPDTRQPSEIYRLPVVLAARSGLRLCAELESPIDVQFGDDGRPCALEVLGTGRKATYRFLAHGNPVLKIILGIIQKQANAAKGAIAFTLPTSPPQADRDSGT
jgi:hypothetical protein